jgi:hypothetical protein
MSEKNWLLKVVFSIFLRVHEKLTHIPYFFDDLLHHERIVSWKIPFRNNLIQDFTMKLELMDEDKYVNLGKEYLACSSVALLLSIYWYYNNSAL